MGVEGAGDLFENADGWVYPPAFEPAHVRPVDLGLERQILLRSASRHPQPADDEGFRPPLVLAGIGCASAGP